MLDHIIKLKKDRTSKKVALISKLKEEEQEVFVKALLAKKEAQKEAKRQKRLRCMSQNTSMQKSILSEEESEISSDQSERTMII